MCVRTRCDVSTIEFDLSVVTCGSVIKLQHVATEHRLHSHQVNYGGGSGQQSVTGYPEGINLSISIT